MNGAEELSLIELQSLLLPPALPSVKCTEVAAAYRPHNDSLRIGGDWYDLIDRDDNQVVAIVGDVVGHGVAQISAMGQLRAAANALGRQCKDPHQLLSWLDDFAKDVPRAHFATMAVLMLDGSMSVRLASAGHPPMLKIKVGGGFEVIEDGRRPPLTIRTPRSASAVIPYEVDDVLLLFTDGLVERRTGSYDKMLEALGEFVSGYRQRSCTEIAERILDEFAHDVDDDIALVVLRPRNHRAPDYHLKTFLPSTVTHRTGSRSATLS